MPKVDTNRSIPIRYDGRGLYKATVEAMEIGNSFDLPLDAKSGAVYAAARRQNRKVSIRRVILPDGQQVKRIWRIE